MEPLFGLAFGGIVAASIYLLLSRNILRIIVGLLMLSNGVNLSIFMSGRMGKMTPPILSSLSSGGDGGITGGAPADMANPLPQALILTAIVISFALTAFTVVLFERMFQAFRTVDSETVREVEPCSLSEADDEPPIEVDEETK